MNRASYSGSSIRLLIIFVLPLVALTSVGRQTHASTILQELYFQAIVSPQLTDCRACHHAGGIADTTAGRRFMLSLNAAEDFDLLQRSWQQLQQQGDGALIWQKAANTASQAHDGGAFLGWGEAEPMTAVVKAFTTCWEAPDQCQAVFPALGQILRAQTATPLPLLADINGTGGRNYAAAFCETQPDAAELPQDPRELIAGKNIGNRNFAVFYNDPFEVCETPALFENQRQQNALLIAAGKPPVYSAKPRPKTCGEWRTAVEAGRRYITTTPITSAVLTRQSLYQLTEYLGFTLSRDPIEASALMADTTLQRYGWPPSPFHNPFPMPGEDPNTSNGGSLQLPIAMAQIKDAKGRWTGQLGFTCFTCHIGQIGRGEVTGHNAYLDGHAELHGSNPYGTYLSLNGSNIDTGLALYDVSVALGRFGPNSLDLVLNNPGFMANRTRGSNAADQEIVNVLLGRDLDSLDWRSRVLSPAIFGKLIPTIPATGGDQDVPTWWWSHNKSRYLWIGLASTGSSRNNFFPASTNPEDGHWSKAREGDFQDMDIWINANEAPAYPYGYCSGGDGSAVGNDDLRCINPVLARAGSILFHQRDLWAGWDNNDIPRPPGGNGSCASCHGAYAPRYIHQSNYLPDPRLAGMVGYTVPLKIIGTDPAQSDLQTLGGEKGFINLSTSWFGYPDAKWDYRYPEEKSWFEESFDEVNRWREPGTCRVKALGGYHTPPLHGVWATAPYFHNGSVPDVWGVLKPGDRPDVWLRQLVPPSEASQVLGDRGFDADLDRAFDADKLGWRYTTLRCDDLVGVKRISCFTEARLPSFMDLVKGATHQLLDYMDRPYQTLGTDEVVQRAVFNTHGYGKGNEGHEFTRVLSDAERHALIEYMKTL